MCCTAHWITAFYVFHQFHLMLQRQVWIISECFVRLCVRGKGFRGQSVFLEMRNIFSIDSRGVCLSVPRADSLHCCSSFTAELFILVSRASQLTHWGALCGESSLLACVRFCVCIYMSVLVHVSVWESVWMCVRWDVWLCAWMHNSSEKRENGIQAKAEWGNGRDRRQGEKTVKQDKTERRDSYR